ncbi:acetylcholine receptor subunit gamma isoform X1 [Cyprinodon tularosa]|uniref:acetylcholine receptor subunit gamma isoform X1 n=1 Tax=Cyprinodon tularosa TaxID=77115 RepID=UPI0018E2855D|nr:acetylcholine receptor subunit gamma isoform X1 [Cyprinodon tularosa]
MDSGPGCSQLHLLRVLLISAAARAANLEGELLTDLMKGYNKNVQPNERNGNVTQVSIKMTLTNLISLNEKEEVLTTSVWIEMVWCDYRLRWDKPPRSALYGNITSQLRVPSRNIWLPDIILENNVDGQFEIAYYCNALVSPDGCVYWLPPAIYRSACAITVNYFPFDWQNCSMIFRSQTYSANEIELKLQKKDNYTLEWVEIDKEAFTENGEWAIRHRAAKKVINTQYTKDDLENQQIVFFLVIQRKPVFYIINIIVPCVLFSSLSLLVYFLPAKAGGQKCNMAIYSLLGQTVFLFLIAKKVPETSKAVPLIGKYLMFVMSVTTIVIINCVIVLNVSLRTPNTHKMTDKVREIFLNTLPQLLQMRMKPWTPNIKPERARCRRCSSITFMAKAEEYLVKVARSELMFEKLKERNGLIKSVLEKLHGGLKGGTAEDLSVSLAQASPELRQCVASCKHIAETAKQQNNFQKENEEWFLVARVIDRVCFIVVALVFFIGTIGIFLMGHFNQPPSTPFDGDPREYLPPVESHLLS